MICFKYFTLYSVIIDEIKSKVLMKFIASIRVPQSPRVYISSIWATVVSKYYIPVIIEPNWSNLIPLYPLY